MQTTAVNHANDSKDLVCKINSCPPFENIENPEWQCTKEAKVMSSCSLICPNENENIIKISIKCKMVDNVAQWTKDGEVISVVDIEKHKCAGFLYKVKIFLTGVKFTTSTS